MHEKHHKRLLMLVSTFKQDFSHSTLLFLSLCSQPIQLIKREKKLSRNRSYASTNSCGNPLNFWGRTQSRGHLARPPRPASRGWCPRPRSRARWLNRGPRCQRGRKKRTSTRSPWFSTKYWGGRVPGVSNEWILKMSHVSWHLKSIWSWEHLLRSNFSSCTPVWS